MISHRKRLTVCLVVGAVFIALIAFAILVPRNPCDLKLSNGKRLSHQLLLAYGPTIATNANTSAADEAIRLAGTNSLPLLAEWLRAETPSGNKEIGRRLWAMGIQTTFFPPDDLAVVACKAIIRLGAGGVDLAEDLVAACTNENLNVANMATAALLRQSLELSAGYPPKTALKLKKPLESAIEVLQARALSSQSNPEAERLRILKTIQQRFRSLPFMEVGLKDHDLRIQMHSARILSRRGAAYSEAEPVLWAHLESTNAPVVENAVICLKNYGREASNSIGRLERVLSHRDENVRRAATNAITRIKALQL